jgi:hypothetical protein
MRLVESYLAGGCCSDLTALGGVVLSELRGVEAAYDQTEVTVVPSVLAGSVRCAYPCQGKHAWLGSTSSRFSRGSRW